MTTLSASSSRSIATSGDVATIVWLALLAGAVGVLGGSSRFDAVQIMALRPIAALFVIPALYFLTRDALSQARTLLALLSLMALWMAIQIVPLPPTLWQSLPGRSMIAELDGFHGLEETWRPISLSPMRGWNALFALVFPASAMLLAIALKPKPQVLFWIVVALGVADASLGLMQILSGRDSALYYYEKTNLGAPVGIFANENHSAVFSVIVLLLIARLGLSTRRSRSAVQPLLLSAAFLIVLIAVLVSGSRAGLGLGLATLVAIAIMAWLWLKQPRFTGKGAGPLGPLVARPRLVLVIGFAAVAALLVALMQFGRAPGAIDAFNQNAFEDLRWRIVPLLVDLMAQFWLLGTGFGSFDSLFLIYESVEFQGQAYLNQAHNDWAQVVIEGGLPAIALLFGLLWWIFATVRSLFAKDALALARCIFWSMLIMVIALASVFDYPLRTPIFQMVGAWLLIALAFEAHENRATKRAKLD